MKAASSVKRRGAREPERARRRRCRLADGLRWGSGRPRRRRRHRHGRGHGLRRRCSLGWQPDLAVGELLDLLGELAHATAEIGGGRLLLGGLRRLRVLLGLALQLGETHAQVGELVREPQALRLHGQRPVLRDLLRLALEAVENLAEEGREHVLVRPRLCQCPAGSGVGQEGGRGVACAGLRLALSEQARAHELGPRDASQAVPNHRAQRPALDPPRDRLPAHAGRFSRLCDRVRPQTVVPGLRILPKPAGRGNSVAPSGVPHRGRNEGLSGPPPGTPRRNRSPNRHRPSGGARRR